MGHDFTDVELSAFLDGEADETLERRILDQLKVDSLLATEIEAFRAASAHIQKGFGDLLAEAPSMPADLNKQQPRAGAVPLKWFGGGIATGLAGGLAASLLLGGLFSGPSHSPWAQAVADYQVLYIPQTIAVNGLGEDVARQQIETLNSNFDIDLMNLPDLPGLELRRAQLLGFEGKPLLQIVYSDMNGGPVALCLVESAIEAPSALETYRLKEMEAAVWRSQGHDFILIGGNDAALIKNAAERAQISL